MRKKEPSVLSKKLCKKLNELFDLKLNPETVYINRINAGHWQRSEGAWCFDLWDKESGWPLSIGSQERVTDIVKSDSLEIYQRHFEKDIIINHSKLKSKIESWA